MLVSTIQSYDINNFEGKVQKEVNSIQNHGFTIIDMKFSSSMCIKGTYIYHEYVMVIFYEDSE